MKLPPTNVTEHQLHVETLFPPSSTSYTLPLETRPVTVRRATLPVLVVEGPVADGMGGVLLQRVADDEGLPVVINGRSEFHGERIYHPAKHLMSMERMVEQAEAQG